MNKTLAKKYLVEIKNARAKHLTSDALSKSMGIYPEIIREQLSYFEPLITMDMDVNIRDLVPSIEEYIEKEELKAEKKPTKPTLKKSDVKQYKSVGDFVYKKFSINGLVDYNATLTEMDLKILRKLVEEELGKGAKKPKKKAKKR